LFNKYQNKVLFFTFECWLLPQKTCELRLQEKLLCPIQGVQPPRLPSPYTMGKSTRKNAAEFRILTYVGSVKLFFLNHSNVLANIAMGRKPVQQLPVTASSCTRDVLGDVNKATRSVAAQGS